jgi:hypothetical protein
MDKKQPSKMNLFEKKNKRGRIVSHISFLVFRYDKSTLKYNIVQPENVSLEKC